MADSAQSIPRRKKPWALTFFGLIAAGGLVVMPFLAGPPDAEKMPDIVRFIGHFHPVLLHLPIGVFILIIVQELGAIFGRRSQDEIASSSLFPLFFGAASAILSVIAGFLLYQGDEGFGGNELVETHLWSGIAFAAAAVITFILKAWTVALRANPAFYRLLLFASVGVMSFASHQGASVTHGEGYLTEYAPAPIKNALGLETKTKATGPDKGAPVKKLEDRIVYADVVVPILEKRCIQCHKESKMKGKFRMDTYELLVKGGKEGSGIEPGKSAESNILKRVALPKDDEEHMPPEGKTPMEEQEVAIIKWWIDGGADPLKTVKDSNAPAALMDAIAKIAPSTGSTADVPDSDASPHAAPKGPDEALVKAVAAIAKEFPGALTFESQGSSMLTFTAVSLRSNLDDASFKKLAPVTAQLVTVDLSATKITDQAVAQLAAAKNLRLIRLSETAITDAAIDTLLKLPELESINLYGTKVTDAGVSKLSAMPKLKRLYLWKTAVTPETIKAIKEKLPNCEIITGIAA